MCICNSAIICITASIQLITAASSQIDTQVLGSRHCLTYGVIQQHAALQQPVAAISLNVNKPLTFHHQLPNQVELELVLAWENYELLTWHLQRLHMDGKNKHATQTWLAHWEVQVDIIFPHTMAPHRAKKNAVQSFVWRGWWAWGVHFIVHLPCQTAKSQNAAAFNITNP